MLGAGALAVLLASCGGSSGRGTTTAVGGAATAPLRIPSDRVYSLDRDRRDGSLLIGTDSGLFRWRPGQQIPSLLKATTPSRSGPVVLGATSLSVAPDGRLFTTGHPRDPVANLPEALGLLVSSDA